MSAEDRVWRHDGRELYQGFAAECLSFDRQEPPLAIGQKDSFLAKLLEKSLNLGVLKFDDLLLPLVDPGRQRDKHHLPGLQDEAHDLLAGEIGNLHHAARIAKRQDGKSAESEKSITP